MIPWATTNFNIYLDHNNQIAREILDYYFELKKKYSENGLSSNTVEQQILPPTTDEKIDEETEEQLVNE